MAKSSRVQENIDWIESNLHVPEGRLVGSKVKLSKAQREWMQMIYGSPTRIFICSLPRKNGKTSFSAMLLLLHLVGPEAKANAQLYSAAQSRDQASILFALAAKMVRMSPDLATYVTVRDTAKQLVCEELGTVYRALSAEASTAYGLSPSLVIHDEIGQVKGSRSELFEALETASAAQEEPLSILISTQAPTDSDLFSVLIDDAKTGADPRTKLVLYSVPDDADCFDRKEIEKAQPNWHLMNHEEVFKMIEDAKRMPSRENGFRNLVANQRVNLVNPFISREVWESCAERGGEFVGDVFLGLDLSVRQDLTALVAVGKDDEGFWSVQCQFFTPLNGLDDRSRRDRTPYDLWVKQGWITATPGSSVDYELVAQAMLDLSDRYNVVKVAFDRYRMKELEACLSRMGRELPLEPFGQGFVSMAPALDALESELLNGRMRHGGNPVLRMCAANAVVTKDPAGNRKLDKSKATGRIDGMVALVMAQSVASANPVKAEPRYEMFFV